MAGNGRAAQEEECERLRWAAEGALQQLDWCIGYLHTTWAVCHTGSADSCSAATG